LCCPFVEYLLEVFVLNDCTLNLLARKKNS
jgi:hypothetical protein